jgi:CRISPR-associated protein Cmr1
MSRKQPENSEHARLFPPDVTKQSSLPERTMKIGTLETKMTVQTRQYKLITPLFGGGAKPGENDLDNLIRGTEIRGQLRFWWRAIRGWQYKNVEELNRAEGIIWGSAATDIQKEKGSGLSEDFRWKMSVQIEVEVNNVGRELEAFSVSDDEHGKIRTKPTNRVPAYAAFPLQPERDEINSASKALDVQLKKVREGVSFTLTISFVKEWKTEVLAALWAWENFGGIGARTRRGFGAIQQDGNSPDDLAPVNRLDAENWIKNQLRLWGAENKFPEKVPHLSPNMQLHILGPATKPAFIWDTLIDKLKKYRQQRDPCKDKKSGKTKSGPNKWPEAEAIRKRISDQLLKGRNTNPPDKFPRAVFGLPIVFHFINEPKADNTILQGKDEKHDRLSSPLILRPLGCGKNEALGLVAVLEGWDFPPDGLELANKKGSLGMVSISKMRLNSSEAKNLRLKGISGEEKDALQAFLNYLKTGEK